MASDPTGYVRNPGTGLFSPPGATKSNLRANFLLGGALPSWLITSNTSTSTATPAADSAPVAMSATEDGYYRVGTKIGPGDPTISGDSAVLFGPELYTSRVRAIHWQLSGVYFNDAYVGSLVADCHIGIRNAGGANAGASVGQTSTETTMQFRSPGVSGTTDARYELRTSAEANKRRSIGVLLLPETKELALTEGDVNNVVDWYREPAMGAGLVRPFVQIVAREGARKSFRFTEAELTVWQH